MAKFEEVKDGVIFPSGAKNEAYMPNTLLDKAI